jgi:hypothetical protein
MSDEPTGPKRPHPIRLAIFMLIGAGFGLGLSPVRSGHGWPGEEVAERARVRTVLYMVCGCAIGGGALEFLVRIGQRD